MYADNLISAAEELEQQLAGASSAKRLQLQPEFTRLLDEMRLHGEKIPPRMRQLDSVLVEEAIEAQFDNLPL